MPEQLSDVIHTLGDNFSRFRSDMDRRMAELEAKADMPANPGAAMPGVQRMTGDQREHMKAFEHWMRNPRSQTARAELEQRAVDGLTGSAGGLAVPEVIGQQIAKRLRDISPVRSVARVVTVASSDYKELVDVGGTASGWVGETDTRSETDTPSLEEVAPSFGMLYAYPAATEESIADIFFDVGAWLTDRVSEELSVREGAAFISGDGSNKPIGFLDGTPTQDADGSRAFGVLKYLPTGAADAFAAEDPADVLWQTVYDLRAGYRANARWMMNSATAGVIRRFKDADGNYLWRDGLVIGQPPALCGYPVVIAEDMPDLGADAFPVAFGDFSRGYLIADQIGLRITVDDNITSPGYVKWYVRKRLGGKILDDNAIRLIKCETIA